MKKLVSILLVLVLMLSLVGCATPAESPSTSPSDTAPANPGSESPSNTGEKTYRVGAIVGSREHVFYNLIEESILATAEELGFEALTYDGQLDANVQANIVADLVAQKVDAISLATVDAAGVGPALEQADQAGIPCFTFDSACANADFIKCHVGTDNVKGGELGAQEVLRLVPEGNVAFIGNPASSSVIDRENGFKKGLEGQDKVVLKFEGDYQGDANVAMQLMQDWLAADPDIKAVFCAGDPAAAGALAAIKAAGANTLVIGYDGNPEAITAIKDTEGDGKWWVSEISQDPKKIGKVCMEQIMKYLETGKVDAELIPIDPYIITLDYIKENNL